MLKAYIDDSGSDQHGEHFVLGGLIAPVYTWGYIEHVWDGLLDKYKLPYFKMSEANACEGNFRGWSEAQRNECVEDFLDVITNKGKRCPAIAAPLAVSIHKAEFRDVVSQYDLRKKPSPYPFLFMEIVRHMRIVSEAMRSTIGCTGRLVCVFDRQHKPGADIERMKSIMKRVDDIRGLAHVSSQDFVALQAADMTAWSVRRTLADGVEHPLFEAIIRRMYKAHDTQVIGSRVMTAEELHGMFEAAASIKRRSATDGID